MAAKSGTEVADADRARDSKAKTDDKRANASDGRRKNRKSKRERSTAAQYLQYLAFRGFSGFLRLLPVGMVYAIGRGLGTLGYRLGTRHRRTALINLDIAYGDTLTPEEKHQIVRESYQNMVLVSLDVVTIPRLLRPENVDRYIDRPNIELADKAKAKHGFAIYVTGHHGSWEVLGTAVGSVGHSFHALARPMRNRFINDYLVRSREMLGQRVVSKYGVMTELIRLLRAGESVGFVADQDARRHGIFVDFFGVPSSTIPSPALLAYRFDIPVIVGHCQRVGGRFRFRGFVDAVIEPDTSRPREEEVRRMTQEVSLAMESFVRKNPGQYLWLHRRWKTRPEGEESPYK